MAAMPTWSSRYRDPQSPQNNSRGDEQRVRAQDHHEVQLLGGVELALLGKRNLAAHGGRAHQEEPFHVVRHPAESLLNVVEMDAMIIPVPQRGEGRENHQAGPGDAVEQRKYQPV
jgi:hypothetical protein